MKTLLTLTAFACLIALTPAQAQQKVVKKQPVKTSATASVKPKPVAAKTIASKPAPAAQSQASLATVKAQPAPQEVEAAPAQPAPRQQTTQASTPQKSSTSRRSSSLGSSISGRNKYLNLGIGLGAYGAGGLPLGASFEVDLKNNISIGGSFDYSRYTYNSYGYKWNYTFYYVGARASYHVAELLNISNSKFDPYAGLSLGFHGASYKSNDGYSNDYASPYSSGLFLGVHLGARYLFTEKIGAFAELGYGVSALKIGLTAKF